MTKMTKKKSTSEPKVKTEPAPKKTPAVAVGKSSTDEQDITLLKEKYAAMAKDMPHREYGLALDEVVKTLSLVESALKVVADVEADIKKRAEAKEKAKF
jgi:predicted transcriptional regulator